jgi:hypothetical protein
MGSNVAFLLSLDCISQGLWLDQDVMDAPFTVRTCSILCFSIILEMMLKFDICQVLRRS